MNRFLQTLMIILLLTAVQMRAQENLILNPGFEKTDTTKANLPGEKKDFTAATYWNFAGREAPDFYYRSPFPVIFPYKGNGTAGISLYRNKSGKKRNRQYLTGTLKEPLKPGKTYCLSVAVALHRTCRFAIDHVGISFDSDDADYSKRRKRKKIKPDFYLSENKALVNMRWRVYSATFTATGDETKFIIGTFGKAKVYALNEIDVERYGEEDALANQAYYMLDNFKLTEAVNGTCGCFDVPQQSDQPVRGTVFALDVSASMKEGRVLDTMLFAMQQKISRMPGSEQVGLVTFSGTAQEIFSGKRSELNTDSLMNVVRKIKPGGGTNVNDGLTKAYDIAEKFSKSRKDSTEVILVSDGKFTLSDFMLRRIDRHYDVSGIRLNIIQIEEFSRELANSVSPAIEYQSVKRSRFYSVFADQKNNSAQLMAACPCAKEKNAGTNPAFLFIADKSGSTRLFNKRICDSLEARIRNVPDSVYISVYGFDDLETEIYSGPARNIKNDSLGALLKNKLQPKHGTSPAPSINNILTEIEENKNAWNWNMLIISDISETMFSSLKNLNSVLTAFSFQNEGDIRYIRIRNTSKSVTRFVYDPIEGNMYGENDSRPKPDLTSINPCGYRVQPYCKSRYSLTHASSRNNTALEQILVGILSVILVLISIVLKAIVQ